MADYNWNILVQTDTLSVKVKKQCAGTLIYETQKIDSINGVEVISKTIMGFGRNLISLVERRVYGANGRLITASQKLKNSTGTSEWEIFKRDNKWTRSIIVGGVVSENRVSSVPDNILLNYSITDRILKKQIAVGDCFYDTLYDLTTDEIFYTITKCISVPNFKNINYHFVNNDSRYNLNEKWIVNQFGRTVSQEFQPLYIADHEICEKNSNKKVNYSDLFSVIGDVCTGGLNLNIGSENTLDTSILFLYKKEGNSYRYRYNCSNEKITNYNSEKWVGSSVSIQSENSKIERIVDSLISPKDNSNTVVKKLTDFTYKILKKKITASFSNAVEALDAGYGDCSEHAVLLAALLRAADIKATVVLGLVNISNGKGYIYHAWVIADILGIALYADAALGRYPACSGYVPLILDNDGAGAMRLSNFLGNIKITCQ